MKRLKRIIEITLVIVAILAGMHVSTFSRISRLENSLSSLEMQYAKRTWADSVYLDHLSKCSFIERGDLALDSRGYVYSQYHKRYK